VDWGRRFVFRDHLGSTNVIINGSSGLLLWRDRYLPFGDVRDTYRRDAGFSLQTQYRFTGQRLEQRLGTPEGGLDRGLCSYGAQLSARTLTGTGAIELEALQGAVERCPESWRLPTSSAASLRASFAKQSHPRRRLLRPKGCFALAKDTPRSERPNLWVITSPDRLDT